MPTHRNHAQQRFAAETSQLPRNARTLLEQMERVEEAKRKALGDRIRELRGHKPQRLPADACGVTPRAYQAWEYGESWPSWDVERNELIHAGDYPAP